MKDTREKRRRKTLRGRELEEALELSMPSYTPQHRRAVLKGLRILARVAIRSYLEERAETSPRPQAIEDDGEGRKLDGLEAERGQEHGV
ncbi:MAG: hypothetical protein OYI31_08650 [Chloroflexota bacterium]|nr:hypothetical protein [Chloroflexota bacterium]